MTTMIPAVPLDFNYSEGEESMFEALGQLPDPYHVFQSLRWIHKRRQGEAGFLVFDPQCGLLVFEVMSRTAEEFAQ